MKKYIIPFLSLSLLVGCVEDERNDDSYNIPTEYYFTNVKISGQVARLDMLEEIETYVKSGADTGTSLDKQKLLDMFANLKYGHARLIALGLLTVKFSGKKIK